MAKPIAPNPNAGTLDGMPAQPGRVRATAITALLLTTWATFTLGARPLTPVVAGIAERVERALGLDVAVADSDQDAE